MTYPIRYEYIKIPFTNTELSKFGKQGWRFVQVIEYRYSPDDIDTHKMALMEREYTQP